MRQRLRDPRVAAPLYGVWAALACYAYAFEAGFRPPLWSLTIPAILASAFLLLTERLRSREPEAFVESIRVAGIFFFGWTYRSWVQGDFSAFSVFLHFVLAVFMAIVFTASSIGFWPKAKPKT